MNPQTPRGFATTPGTRDVLPPESTRLLDVQARIRERFRLSGYGEVLTPALEYSEVIEELKLRDASFKLFDLDNQMVMLRPEMTTPIARLVAQRLRNFPPPYKLSYVLPVYRRASVGRGQSQGPRTGRRPRLRITGHGRRRCARDPAPRGTRRGGRRPRRGRQARGRSARGFGGAGEPA